jgi:hypothetical protein
MTHDTAGTAMSGTAGFGAVERRLLAPMPLHAVTDRHGEDGLRERLLIEAGRLPAAGRERVRVALEWMRLLHAGGPAAARAVRLPPAAGRDPDPGALPGRRRGRGVRGAAARHRRGSCRELTPGGSRDDAVAVVAGEFGGGWRRWWRR